MVREWLDAARGWTAAPRDEVHGIAVDVVHDSREYDPELLRARVREALELVAAHGPLWIARMRRLGVRIRVQRTPGTRAKLLEGRVSVLDSYFVHAFLPAQVASSIVHEATHARVRARGAFPAGWTLAREERMCRRSELGFGRALRAAGVPGADAVVGRAAESLALSDAEVAPAVDWNEMRRAEEEHRRAQASARISGGAARESREG